LNLWCIEEKRIFTKEIKLLKVDSVGWRPVEGAAEDYRKPDPILKKKSDWFQQQENLLKHLANQPAQEPTGRNTAI